MKKIPNTLACILAATALGNATEYTISDQLDAVAKKENGHNISVFALENDVTVTGNNALFNLAEVGNQVDISCFAGNRISSDKNILALTTGADDKSIVSSIIGNGTSFVVDPLRYDYILIASKSDETAVTVKGDGVDEFFSVNSGYSVAFTGKNSLDIESDKEIMLIGVNAFTQDGLYLLIPNSNKYIPLVPYGMEPNTLEVDNAPEISMEPVVSFEAPVFAPAPAPKRMMRSLFAAPAPAAPQVQTYTQRVDANSAAPLYVKPSHGGGFGIYSSQNQDYGWKHTFPDFAQQNLQILSVKLNISAYDVDAEPHHGEGGEYDGITGDGSWLNPQYLQGTDNSTAVTVFDVDPQALMDGELDVFCDIDMRKRGWLTTLNYSTMSVEYIYSTNEAPYQPEATVLPVGCTYTTDDLVVTVTGPTPADPEGETVRYEYRWLVDPGTGNYIDDEFANRNDHTGNRVPAADTRDNDKWIVEVTAIDVNNARSTKSVLQFTTIGDCNTPPIAHAGQYAAVSINQEITLDGSLSNDPDGSIASYKWEQYENGAWSQIGSAVTVPYTFSEVGVKQVRLTVTDDKGSSASALVYINVIENAAPVANAGADAFFTTDENCEALVSLDGSGSTDPNGDVLKYTWTYGQITAEGEFASMTLPLGIHPIELKVEDGKGGVSLDTVEMTVEDRTAPVADMAVLDTIFAECDASIEVAPTATDACMGTITGTTIDNLVITEQGTHEVTWSYDDGNGNVTTQKQTVIVKDVTAPVPVKAVLDTVFAECSAMIEDAPKAEDNCKGTITGTTADALTFTEQGTHEVTWSYDDGNGNVTTQKQTVIVKDVTAPVPVKAVLDTVFAECSAMIEDAPKAEDNCKGTITGTTADALTFTEQGTHEVTWSYDDGNGNVSTQKQTVIVKDVTAPVPVKAVLDTVFAECSAMIKDAPKAEDACEGTITGTTGDALSYTTQGTHVVTWSYDDGNGNVATQKQIVVIMDVTAPVMSDIPADVTEELKTAQGNAITLAAPKAVDNCGGAVTVVSDAPVIFPLGTTVVTFTATDVNGNISTAKVTVKIEDTTAPVFENVTIDKEILWPPKHQMEEVKIVATVSDISGSRDLSVNIASNEADANVFPGDVANDIAVPVIDQVSGKIDCSLRAERNHLGSDRDYTIVLTATDPSGNSSSYELHVTVPVKSQEGTWIPYHDYKVGDLVSHNGKTWACVYTHTSLPHWTPDAEALYFWVEITYNTVWVTNKVYAKGDVVSHNGEMWECTFGHTSQDPYKPGTPNIWFWNKL